MKQEKTRVLEHNHLIGDYRILTLFAPEIGPLVLPGQFLELLVPHLTDAVLRRPFSIFKADFETVSILYKVVGKGTNSMKGLSRDDVVDVFGPLGNGFPTAKKECYPVLAAGGYGSAALYLQAKALPDKGTVFLGGRSSIDILCVEEFKDLGWDVQIATEDGSQGTTGLITDIFDKWLAARHTSDESRRPIELFACGPEGMLRAMGKRAEKNEFTAWLSMDRHMACGVGVCLTCVIKKKEQEDGWQWTRCCKDGPIFESREILWDE